LTYKHGTEIELLGLMGIDHDGKWPIARKTIKTGRYFKSWWINQQEKQFKQTAEVLPQHRTAEVE
jgi:endo-beta-N-acetylglucosaminidase D